MNATQNSFPGDFSFVDRYRCPVALIFFGLLALLSGCDRIQALKAKSALIERVNANFVLLIKPDLQLSVVTAAGLQEHHAEWTEIDRRNVAQALDALPKEKNVSLIAYQAPRGDPDRVHRYSPIMKMHAAVGEPILNYQQPP